MFRHRIVSLAILAACPAAASAQGSSWALTPELSLTHHSGVARDTTSFAGEPMAGPAPTLMAGLRLERGGDGFRAGLAVHYARHWVTVRNASLQVNSPDGWRLLELAPEGSLPLLRFGRDAALRAHAGAAAQLWMPTPSGEDNRWTLNALAALSAEIPVSARLATVFRVEGALGPSVFDPGQLPAEFERRASVRTRVGVGVRWRGRSEK
ncbi:MAG: hypothetical protein AB7Q69_15420 [Gemmatimonadales bacterium]